MKTPRALAATAFAAALLLGCGRPAETANTSEPGKPADVALRDCAECPALVAVPAGEFMMGSPTSELFRGAEAQHRVTVPAFAIGKYEVTFDEWEACVADGGCGGFKPDDQGWGRGKQPVIGVSFDDAQAYIAWLNKTTGKHYRLPSESEWEYAARAGATTAFSFGNSITSEQANYDGSTGYNGAAAGPNRQKTLPVGSFPPNAFGLYDMHGNVWEWVEDCWSDEYTAANPSDGKPFLGADCSGRVMRGGSWEDYAGDIRAAARVGSNREDQTWSDGFRVARDMD
jgi:formylglycine-generating enzyme required for sulfatase activity